MRDSRVEAAGPIPSLNVALSTSEHGRTGGTRISHSAPRRRKLLTSNGKIRVLRGRLPREITEEVGFVGASDRTPPSIIVLLLSSRRYLTAEQIRAAVSGNPEEQEAFKRMFERDKEELRDLGIPLETGRASQFDDDLGYRISRQDYELPRSTWSPTRRPSSASRRGSGSPRSWQARPRARAEAAGGEQGDRRRRHAEPAARRPAAADHAGAGLRPAVGGGPRPRPVTFDYLASGRSEVTKRTLEPWGVVNRRGRWYVAGHDRARGAPPFFRMSRITGPVKLAGPPGASRSRRARTSASWSRTGTGR